MSLYVHTEKINTLQLAIVHCIGHRMRLNKYNYLVVGF
jgi:hypothetical protein